MKRDRNRETPSVDVRSFPIGSIREAMEREGEKISQSF